MENSWIGLVPAAGKGLRLGLPYPKELYPVIHDNHYKPVAQFVLDNLVAAEVKHIVFVINETKHQLISFFGDGHRFGCNISYTFQEPLERGQDSTSPGLAHALDSAYHLTRDKTVFFGMADTIMQPKEIFNLAYQKMETGDDAVLCLFNTQEPQKFGMVRRESESVLEIVDKPRRSELTEMWGCIIWRPAFTDFLHHAISNLKIYDFATILNRALGAGLHMRGVLIPKGNYLDLGSYQEIMELDRRLRKD